jgi:choline dehydrogenase
MYLSVGAYFGDQWNYLQGAPVDGFQYATTAASLVAPLSRGNISISSADMADQPLINPNWLTHPTDQEVAVAAYKRVRAMWASSVMKGVVVAPEYYPGLNVSTDDEILTLIRRSFNTVSHATSTCKMGKSNDSLAVVDNHARVFGVSKLRVVDASALPFLPPGMPMGTLCVLSLLTAY